MAPLPFGKNACQSRTDHAQAPVHALLALDQGSLAVGAVTNASKDAFGREPLALVFAGKSLVGIRRRFVPQRQIVGKHVTDVRRSGNHGMQDLRSGEVEMPPKYFERVIGKRAKQAIKRGTPISRNLL